MTQNKIDADHEPWKMYHGKKDMLDTTHSMISVDGPFGLYNMAIELPNEQIFPVMKLMDKEVDAADRFSLTDGLIQGEFEIWDGDYEKRLYFCVEFTLEEAIMFAKQENPMIGFSVVNVPNVLVGGQKIFNMDDLRKVINLKQTGDAKITKPSHRWKTG